MEKSDFAELERIRNELSRKFFGFPEGCCCGSAVRINDLLGYELVRGKFHLGERQFVHYWNETPNGEIVDLTARQFSPEFPEILVTSRHSDLAKNHYDNAYFRDMPL